MPIVQWQGEARVHIVQWQGGAGGKKLGHQQRNETGAHLRCLKDSRHSQYSMISFFQFENIDFPMSLYSKISSKIILDQSDKEKTSRGILVKLVICVYSGHPKIKITNFMKYAIFN